MITTRKGRNGRYAVLFAVILALIGYFSYHAVNGDHGLHRRTALAAQVKELETGLAALKKQREHIEHDVALVTKRARTEPDLLDEQARSLLNFVRPGEIVVLRPSASGNPTP